MTSRPARLTPGQRTVLIALSGSVAIAAIALAAILALPAGDPEDVAAIESTTTTQLVATTTTIAATTTTTAAPTTTSEPEPTTTTTPATTTTTEAFEDTFVLRPDGIDRLFFGTDPGTTLDELSERLGDPTSDTGWVDQAERYDGLCGGTEARFVTYETLQVFFTDRQSGWADEGDRHFASYSLVEGDTEFGFSTSRGIGLGATVSEVADAYRDDVEFEVHPAFEVEVFEVDPPGDGYLLGFLTGLGDDDEVTEMVGGFSCGE